MNLGKSTLVLAGSSFDRLRTNGWVWLRMNGRRWLWTVEGTSLRADRAYTNSHPRSRIDQNVLATRVGIGHADEVAAFQADEVGQDVAAGCASEARIDVRIDAGHHLRDGAIAGP